MRGHLSRRLGGAAILCALLAGGPAVAGGSGMPWEGPLQQVVESITGPVVQAAAVVAVVVFGAGIAMSENGSSMRRGGRGCATDVRVLMCAMPMRHENGSPLWGAPKRSRAARGVRPVVCGAIVLGLCGIGWLAVSLIAP